MSNKYSVLIVDSDVAFAAILKESLEQDGRYRTTMAANAGEALQAMASAEFDLVVVDLGLPDQDGCAFARGLREQWPELRLMLIPIEGDELPPEMADLDVQGVLPKPFFFPELPGRVAAALGLAEGGGPSAAEAVASAIGARPTRPVLRSDERLALLRERFQEVIQEMSDMSREISAEAVILTCGGKLIAHTGRLAAEEADRLAQVADESWRTSARVAKILGREQLRFEQSVEGGEHLFYSLAVAEDIILSAALRAHGPLGMIRHRAKTAADKLRAMIDIAD